MAKKQRNNSPSNSYGGNADPLGSLDDDLLSPSSLLPTAPRNYFQDDSGPASYDQRLKNPHGDNLRRGPGQSTSTVVRNRQSVSKHFYFKNYSHYNSQTKGVLAFQAPSQIPLCRRRKERREIFFAKKLYLSRGRAGPRRRTPSTWMSCR